MELRTKCCLAIFLYFACQTQGIGCFTLAREEIVYPDIKTLSVVSPETPRDDGKIRLRIVSFNDFHGNYREKNDALGAAKLITAIKRYANDYPKDYPTSICTFCAGDCFSGGALSYYSTLDKATGKEKPNNPLDRLFGLANVVSACVGNHEFDWGNAFFEDHLQKTVVRVNGKTHPAYSASNIKNKITNRPPGGVPEFDVISPEGTDYNIAVLTLTTLETVTKSLPGTTDGYVFESPGACAKRLMDTLENIDAFIFMTHMSSAPDAEGKIVFRGDTEEMLELIKLKPAAIITAHSHKFVSGKVDGVPILQAGCNGNGLASIDFVIDLHRRSIVEESRDCVNLLPDRENIPPDPEMEQVIGRAAEACDFEVIGTVRETLRKNRFASTDLGSLIAKALATSFRERTKDEPVLAFQHGGGVRTDLTEGTITMEDCFNILPFESRMSLCRLTGGDIMRLLREGFSNKNGALQYSALTFYYASPDAKLRDFKEVAFTFQGKRAWIEPEKEYWVALDSFIVSGGDGFSRDIFKDRVIVRAGPLPRDVLAGYFKENLNGDITLSESDRPAFVLMPDTGIDYRRTPSDPRSLQKFPPTQSP